MRYLCPTYAIRSIRLSTLITYISLAPALTIQDQRIRIEHRKRETGDWTVETENRKLETGNEGLELGPMTDHGRRRSRLTTEDQPIGKYECYFVTRSWSCTYRTREQTVLLTPSRATVQQENRSPRRKRSHQDAAQTTVRIHIA